MNRRLRVAIRWGVLAGACCLAAWGVRQAAAQPAGETEQGEVLTRGQLHEAFAEVISYNPQPGLVVSNQELPPTIQELPPTAGPEGEGFLWIPGYWAWDDERNDFVWISGVWRKPPPGTQWVPGYWTNTEQGNQWISGYWLPVKESETDARVQYLPTPPESREAGPDRPRSSEDDFWIPGYWAWRNARYDWQPGFWGRAAVGWTWTPAYYAWTPRGCVFLGGHWDYPMTERGVPFCPVYFTSAVYRRPGFSYVPWVVLDTGLLESSLFCRPRYSHFYFGDYYNPYYESQGIVPWFAIYHSRFAYNPFYAYRHWYNSRRNPQWAEQVRDRYRYRVDHESARPPHTFAAMRELAQQTGREGVQDVLVAESLDTAMSQRRLPLPLQKLQDRQRQQQIDVGSQFAGLATERSRIERGRPGAAQAPAAEAQEAEIPLGNVRKAIQQATGITQPPRELGLPQTQQPQPGRETGKQQPTPPETPMPAEKPQAGRPEPETKRQPTPPETRQPAETPRRDREEPDTKEQPTPPETREPAEKARPRGERMEETPRQGIETRPQPKAAQPPETMQQPGRPRPGERTPSTSPPRAARPEAGRQEMMPEPRFKTPERPEATRPGEAPRLPSTLGPPSERPTRPESSQTPQGGRMPRPETQRQQRPEMMRPSETPRQSSPPGLERGGSTRTPGSD